MPKFCGFDPKPATRQAVKKFEDEVMIGKDYRFLIPTVYLDVNEKCWSVAIAYSTSRPPGMHWQENLLEVRYTYSLKNKVPLTLMRSDPFEDIPIVGRTFEDPDTFALYAITKERELVNCPDPDKQRNEGVPIIGRTFIDPDIYEKELLNRLADPYELQDEKL
ncbi:MAG: hypothetical protein IPI63_00310 [Methanothrix sp.]|jgi:hypothetical protein|uniref:hypothetical protein n=1 Tax=Methanothrix sp. TaxID=90426 RepID=UPI001BD3D76F|nr:hypothetical protein [Methanothrix sp.]MBK7385238.1 hypothetical protein [Methanothrix sp.]MDI9417255.1 hypothetical protein [Euryarchaeota archaeon]HON34923.1 hypothetical protein [Methanothrix sp.]